jgi:hypothetical protein
MNGDIGNIETSVAAGLLPSGLDLSKYRSHLAHMHLSADREADILVAIWRMMGSFVDRAFGDDPVQHVDGSRVKDARRIPPVVKSDKPRNSKSVLSSAFRKPAAGRRGKESS